ncbi:MAG: SAM-dependent chlorinase/fluorinase [Bacteroidales bacterium]|nr:SAM-dependent chlorinase/fluorinase [Bacteroidales bacterium]
MPIITLTSDWGDKDHYAGAVKGAILNKMSDITIVDISHKIPPFDIEQAAFILRNSYPSFPPGTVHIIGINTEESDKTGHTVVEYKRQFFIGTDNGIFSMLFDGKPDKVGELTINQDSDYFTFSTRDRFVSAAVHLASGNPMNEICDLKDNIVEKILLKPVEDAGMIKGHVIYIDNYENVITNITESYFKEIRKGRGFSIVFRSYEISAISKSYNDVARGEILALFDTGGYLEIAINQGNASGLLGLDLKDMIRIEFT